MRARHNGSKIQENKDYTIEQGRKMNEMLDAFQQKFEGELQNLKEDLEGQLGAEKDQHRKDMQEATDRM